jgi:hypothetical protein
MPPTSTASTDERRAAAQRARLERANRITRLRRQVLATALATFALAFAVIALDGSMGSPTSGSAAASGSGSGAATSSAQQAQDDLATPADGTATDGFDDTGSGSATADSGSSADPLTTSQS